MEEFLGDGAVAFISFFASVLRMYVDKSYTSERFKWYLRHKM